jgi:hypothetical protein
MAEQARSEQRPAQRRRTSDRRIRAGRAQRSFATVLRRSAQCLRIAPRGGSQGGAPTHRIVFTYPDGGEVPQAARRLTRAFGLGLALVLSLRSTRYLCRVFAVGGTHASGLTSLQFTVSLRAFGTDTVRWRARPTVARRRRGETAPIGVTLPLPL